MTLTTEGAAFPPIVRLEAKLASVAHQGRTALVSFYVRGQEDDLAKLIGAKDAELLLGVVIATPPDE